MEDAMPAREPQINSLSVGIATFSILVVGVSLGLMSTYAAELYALLKTNQIMQAMLLPSIVASVYLLMGRFSAFVIVKLRSTFYCSISIKNDDENFLSVLEYVTEQCKSKANSSLLVKTKKKKFDRRSWRRMYNGIADRQAPEMEFRPNNQGNDVHMFVFEGTNMLLSRKKGQTITTGSDRKPLELETMTISAWGTSNIALKNLVKAALEASFRQETEDTTIYVLSSGWAGGWEKALTKKPRSKESVILDGNIGPELHKDAHQFLSSQKWYMERGIPYRRGYLLYGPPGCGKTSFCQVLAGSLKLDVCMLSLSSSNINDNSLAESLREAPPNSILLLEDVDAVFRDRTAQDKNSGVTFSGLLNALDGVASQEGRLFCMTTNHIERLDAALVRPGRCDVKVKLEKASKLQMERMFLRFFEGEVAKSKQFATRLPANDLSMAQLQGYLLEHKGSADAALKHVPQLLQASKPQPMRLVNVYDHLRKVGLQHLAPVFEHHGYRFRSDLVGFKADVVKQWDMALSYDQKTFKRLENLIAQEKTFMRSSYALADFSTIREAFLAAFPSQHLIDCLEEHPSLRRQASHEIALSEPTGSTEPVLHDVVHIDQLSKELCEKLQRSGKVVVSLWQLRWLLSLFPGDPDGAVSHAHFITAPRSDAERRPQWLTTFDWFKRIGMLKWAKSFEDAGYEMASEFQHLQTEAPLKKLISDAKDVTKLIHWIKNDPSHRNLTVGFTLPDRRRLVEEFASRFPSAAATTAAAWAEAMADPHTGYCKASVVQVQLYLSKCSSAAVAMDNRDSLLNVTRDSMESLQQKIPEPTEWVYGWLKEEGLETYASAFIGEKLSTRVDLAHKPAINVNVLVKLGVKVVGDQNHLVRMVQQLIKEDDAAAKAIKDEEEAAAKAIKDAEEAAKAIKDEEEAAKAIKKDEDTVSAD